MFYVAPRASTTPLEQLFRVRVIRMLVEEELLAPELARKLLGWKHSGFSVHNGKPLRRDDAAGLERVAQYIIRNPFSERKMDYNAQNGTVIYRSRMNAKTRRNFEIFTAEEFIAAITQHIPDKGFQMVRYYGWYSNRARGERAKREIESGTPEPVAVDVIDVSEYKETAARVTQRWNKSGTFDRPIATEISAATTFYPAEDYHQKYLVKNPGGYTCHVLRE